jgi:hypothetical protein
MAGEDVKRDKEAQEAMLSRANKSLSVLEKAFIRNGSGRYFVLRTDDLQTTRTPLSPGVLKGEAT